MWVTPEFHLNIGVFVLTEQAHVVSSQMVEWLRRASLQQAPNPYSRGMFGKGSQQPPVTEIDGIVTKNFFTALSIGKKGYFLFHKEGSNRS